MNIRKIAETDFRRSDIRIFREFQKENQKLVRSLKADDIVLFLSKKRNQMLFIHGITEFSGASNDTITEALQSVRHRVLSGSWNPLMLKNYAEEAGLSIDGLSRFEEHFSHLVANDNGMRRSRK